MNHWLDTDTNNKRGKGFARKLVRNVHEYFGEDNMESQDVYAAAEFLDPNFRGCNLINRERE